jgi:hypothetical protein
MVPKTVGEPICLDDSYVVRRVPPEDAGENELAIGGELRILSSYGDGEDDDRL